MDDSNASPTSRRWRGSSRCRPVSKRSTSPPVTTCGHSACSPSSTTNEAGGRADAGEGVAHQGEQGAVAERAGKRCRSRRAAHASPRLRARRSCPSGRYASVPVPHGPGFRGVFCISNANSRRMRQVGRLVEISGNASKTRAKMPECTKIATWTVSAKEILSVSPENQRPRPT